jgi:hypothetical protein
MNLVSVCRNKIGKKINLFVENEKISILRFLSTNISK